MFIEVTLYDDSKVLINTDYIKTICEYVDSETNSYINMVDNGPSLSQPLYVKETYDELKEKIVK